MAGHFQRQQQKALERQRWAAINAQKQPPPSTPLGGDDLRVEVIRSPWPPPGHDSDFALEPDDLHTARREFNYEVEVIDVDEEDNKHKVITMGEFFTIMCILSVVVAVGWFLLITTFSLCAQMWGLHPAADGFGAKILENIRDTSSSTGMSVVLVVILIVFEITTFAEAGTHKTTGRILIGFPVMMFVLIGVIWLMRWIVLSAFEP